MKQIIRVKLSPELAAKLAKLRAEPPGLRWIPEFPGQPTPERPMIERTTTDPVSAVFDRQGVRKVV